MKSNTLVKALPTPSARAASIAFQTAIGITNADRAQKGEKTFLVAPLVYRNVTIQSARYLPPSKTEMMGASLPGVLDRIRAALAEHEVRLLAIDDGSTDGTRAGLTGLEGRRQFRDRPKIAGQAGQVVEDEELRIGQIRALESAIDPGHQALFGVTQP